MWKQINNVKYAVTGLEIIIMDNNHAMHVASSLEEQLFLENSIIVMRIKIVK